MNGFPKLMGTGNPENGDYAAAIEDHQNFKAREETFKSVKPLIIEQIIAIIDKGGPYYIYKQYFIWFVGLLEPNTQDDLKFETHNEAENECERINSEYVAKAILKCLQRAPVDFKSVYDKQVWVDTIERLLAK